jgi:Fe-S cluster biosynthesis and repair protein YggX
MNTSTRLGTLSNQFKTKFKIRFLTAFYVALIVPVKSSTLNQRLLMARTVNCIKLGKEADGMDFPPYPGELGKRIWESVSKEAWAAWLKHQTMLVNENRLNLADARARQYLARQMENHFFGDGADAAQGYVPPTA